MWLVRSWATYYRALRILMRGEWVWLLKLVVPIVTWSLHLIRATQQLSLWTLTGSHRPLIVTVSRVTWSGGHEGAITFQLSIWFVTRLRLSCAQVTNQENTATAAETSGGFLHFKIMVLIINTKTGNGHTLALLPRLPLNTARHQPADRLTQHKMVT